jgi:hypothetical protein
MDNFETVKVKIISFVLSDVYSSWMVSSNSEYKMLCCLRRAPHYYY